MKTIKTFENKKVLVLGLAKSGEAAARLLEKLGAIVTVNHSMKILLHNHCLKKESKLSVVATRWNFWMKILN